MASNVVETLKTWGCDTESAMERMLGDEDFYMDCLNMFYDD